MADRNGWPKGWCPDMMEDYHRVGTEMTPRRACIAMALMSALRAMSRRSSRGEVSITDATLLEASYLLPFGVSVDDVRNVRRRLVALGILEQVRTGKPNRAQVIRVTCWERANRRKDDATGTKGRRKDDGSVIPAGQRGSGPNSEDDGRPTEGRRKDDGRTKPSCREVEDRRVEEEQIHVPLPTCERCKLEETACFCETWDTYRVAVQRWDGPPGGRGAALARWEKLTAKSRAKCRRDIAALVVYLDAGNPATHYILGLRHLSTFINNPKTWEDRPDMQPRRGNQQHKRLIALQGGPSAFPSDPEFFRKRAAQYARENPLPPGSDPDDF